MIELHELTVVLGGKKIINRLSFCVEEGEKVAIAGESGVGKTTLLNVILGFTSFTEGSVKVFGKTLNSEHIQDIRSQIAWMPQELGLQVANMHELQAVLFQFKKNRNYKPDKEKLEAIMDEFGLAKSILNQNFTALSGGQKQRAIMAVCVLLKKPLLLLDEPTSALDNKSIACISAYIKKMEHLTVLSTSHNHQWLDQCDKVININQ